METPASVLILAVVLLVAILALAFVLSPLIAVPSRPRRSGLGQPGAAAALLDQRDTVYRSIQELDFDFATGKLDGADYHVLRDRYLQYAAAVVQSLDAQRGDVDDALEAEVEAEIAVLRAQQQAASARETLACGSCGQPLSRLDRFCSQCGHPIPGVAPS